MIIKNTKTALLCVLVGMFSLVASDASAIFVQDGLNADWIIGNGAGPPVEIPNDDFVFMKNFTTRNIPSGTNPSIKQLALGGDNGSGHVTIGDGSTLTMTNGTDQVHLIIGDAPGPGISSVVQTGGTVDVQNRSGGDAGNFGLSSIYIASNAGGEYTMSGGTLLGKYAMRFGFPGGSGAFNNNGSAGSIQLGGLQAGNANTSINFELDSGGARTIQVVNNVPGDAFGQGDVLLGNNLNVSLAGGASLLPSYTLIEYAGTLTGEFLGKPEGSLVDVGGTDYTLSYLGGAVTLVPEPSALALLVPLGLVACARRKRK